MLIQVKTQKLSWTDKKHIQVCGKLVNSLWILVNLKREDQMSKIVVIIIRRYLLTKANKL